MKIATENLEEFWITQPPSLITLPAKIHFHDQNGAKNSINPCDNSNYQSKLCASMEFVKEHSGTTQTSQSILQVCGPSNEKKSKVSFIWPDSSKHSSPTWPHLKHLAVTRQFNPDSYFYEAGVIISPFSRWENWVKHSLSNAPTPVSGGAGACSLVFYALGCSL